ncbi:MAG: ribonuclease HII [Candidatus Kapaibacteriales bacterium]
MGWDTPNRNPNKTANLIFEKKFWQLGTLVAGVDEAGRGSLAGPVFSACVIYPIFFEPNFVVKDSKLLAPLRREKLFDEITSSALSWSYSFVEAKDIDNTNILTSTHKAMEDAINKITNLSFFSLIDGNSFGNKNIPHLTIVRGDAKCFSIASASIIAKVLRDRWMIEIAHSLYPEYGFDKHKGYGTKFHIEMLKKFGPSPLHRKTFLRKILTKLDHYGSLQPNARNNLEFDFY